MKPTVINLEVPDSNLLTFTQSHTQAIFSGILSTIAMKNEYIVTDHTQFKLNEDFTELTVTELEEKSEPVIKAAK